MGTRDGARPDDRRGLHGAHERSAREPPRRGKPGRRQRRDPRDEDGGQRDAHARRAETGAPPRQDRRAQAGRPPHDAGGPETTVEKGRPRPHPAQDRAERQNDQDDSGPGRSQRARRDRPSLGARPFRLGLIGLDRLFETAGAVAARTGDRCGQGGEFLAPARLATCASSTVERVPAARAPAGLRRLRRAGARPRGFLNHPGQSSRFA